MLAAMIFAVSMTFIDQTIVSIAAPNIQRELGLTSTGVQWVVNAYLLSLAALFAFGGRLADTVGHRKMVTLGVIVFAGASAMCGLTPKGSLAEAWLVTFRVIQGAGGAIMFPAALAIVVQTFPLHARGKALALFFGIAGGLTALGPALGGVLTQWTWRAIFWVNIPVAVIALILIVLSHPVTDHKPARIDYRGLVLIAAGVSLSIFGFQQSGTWGWSDPKTIACVVVGALILVVFVLVERGTTSPLIDVNIFQIRPFAVENLRARDLEPRLHPDVLLRQRVRPALAREVGVLGEPRAALFLHRLRDRGADRRADARPGRSQAPGRARLHPRRGRVLALGQQGDRASTSARRSGSSILTGAGMGFMLGPASTDAVNRASRLSYGEATGITQTVRNYAASLGFAILGSLLVSRAALACHDLARRQELPHAAGLRRGEEHPAVARRHAGAIPALRPPRLRLRDAVRALRDGDRDGRGRRRRLRRAPARRAEEVQTRPTEAA